MLAEKFVQKARLELREEENRKKQALEHFREWIRKHPYIKQIRQGTFITKPKSKFILQFAICRRHFSSSVLAHKEILNGHGIQVIREL